MRVLSLVLLFISFAAQAAPASTESIEKLLAVTKTEAMMDAMYSTVDQVMRQNISRALHGKTIGAEEQKALDQMPSKVIALMREEMGWQKLKPMFVQIYRESFDQEEVDGLLVFYASPAGMATINKMPMVMQKSMALSQSMLHSFMPKMTALINEGMKEAKIPAKK